MPILTHTPLPRRDAADICRHFWKAGIESAYDASVAGASHARYRHVEIIEAGGQELVQVSVQDLHSLSPRLHRNLLAAGHVYVVTPNGTVREFADSYLNPSAADGAVQLTGRAPRTGEHSGYYIDFKAVERAAVKSQGSELAHYL